jgi:hypothetical protein
MTVFSRVHILAENISTRDRKLAKDEPRMQKLMNAPTFVVQKDAFHLMQRADCASAIKALVEADIVRLPYPKMVIEWQIRDGCPAHILGDELSSMLREDYVDKLEPVHEFVHLEEIVTKSGGWGIIASYSFMYVNSRIGGHFEDDIGVVPGKDGFDAVFTKHIDPLMQEIALGSALVALNVALVLMNMRGIDREEHRNDALNKHRVKKGKPAISQYSYLRIGHVYKQDGTRVKYTEGDHRFMPMHVRTAHTRRQHFGKNNEETKIIYVPSVIVNFDPKGEIKKPKQRIVKA